MPRKLISTTLLIIFMFCFTMNILSNKRFKIDLIKTIGDDRDTHTFIKIVGAALSENLDIFIADVKGSFIAKYSWSGEFLGKIGQKGQGPSDFNGPRDLKVIKDKLYLWDMRNLRFVNMDLNLKNLNYHKFTKIGMVESVNFLNDGKVIISGFNWTQKNIDTKVFELDKKYKIVNSFFNKDKSGNSYSKKTADNFINLMSSTPKLIVKDSNDLIFLTFPYVSNPMKIYKYDLKGNHLKTFTFTLDPKYTPSPQDLAKGKGEIYVAYNPAIFSFDNHIVLFHGNAHKKRRKVISKANYLWFISEEGKIVNKLNLGEFTPINLSKDGYLLCKNYSAEIEKLYIYKISRVD